MRFQKLIRVLWTKWTLKKINCQKLFYVTTLHNIYSSHKWPTISSQQLHHIYLQLSINLSKIKKKYLRKYVCFLDLSHKLLINMFQTCVECVLFRFLLFIYPEILFFIAYILKITNLITALVKLNIHSVRNKLRFFKLNHKNYMLM